MKTHKSKIISSISILTIILIWYLFTRDQTKSQELLFPSLEKLYHTLINNYSNIIKFSLITWYRVVVGLLIGIVSGFFFGVIITWSKFLEAIIDPIIEIIRPIPPIALTPFFILWFGLGDLGQLMLVSLGCFMVIVVSTVNAIRNINIIYIRAAKSLGANDLEIYKTIYLPGIMPAISSAIRVAAATGFGLTVAAEYLGAQGGLGFYIRNARVTLNTEAILLAALILGILSLLTDQLIRMIFRFINKWNNN